MTTLLLAELVDENKLRWEQPVTEVYPGFRLGDTETTRQVLVKHLVCACTCLPRQDFEWLFNYATATPRVVARVAWAPCTRPAASARCFNTALSWLHRGLYWCSRGRPAAGARRRLRRGNASTGVRAARNDPHDLRFSDRHARQFCAPPTVTTWDGKTMPARMDNNYSVVPVRPAGGMWDQRP